LQLHLCAVTPWTATDRNISNIVDNCVEQTHSSAVDSRSVGKEVPHLLWNPEPYKSHHWPLPQRILLMTCICYASGYSLD
jgi:hypothetical protein